MAIRKTPVFVKSLESAVELSQTFAREKYVRMIGPNWSILIIITLGCAQYSKYLIPQGRDLTW